MPLSEERQLENDLGAYAWERAQKKLSEPARDALKQAVDAWLNGGASMSDAAAAVREVLPVDPGTIPLDPRNAKVVDGRLFRRSGRRWVAADGAVLPTNAS
jgi:hypothetical protein